MREIKFRVWDKKEKKMYYLDGPFYNSEYHEIAFQNRDINYIRDIEDLELMQYTDFNDTKDNEIYEGDILDFKPKAYKNMLVKHTGWMYWVVEELGLMDGDIKIVGNKYENPELIQNG